MAITSAVPLSNVMINQRMEAEYYKVEALQYLKKKVKWARIGSILEFCQYGSSLPLNEEGEGYKIYRLDEIEDCFLTKPEKWVVLPERQYQSLRLDKNDILFCRTNGNIRYVGRTGILKEDINAVFASYLVRVRPNMKYVLPEYLAIYLNTVVGRVFIERQAMHSNQFNVSAEQLKKIPIPLFDKDFQNNIKKYVDDAVALRDLSNLLYIQAENILLEELGLKNFGLKHKIYYSNDLVKVIGFHRIDAEYFQPAYEEIIKKIQKYSNGYNKLLNEAENIKPDFERQKYPNKDFNYVELADIDTFIGVIKNASMVKGSEAPSRARRVLKKNDLIVSSVEGSLEKIALVDQAYEGALASTGFFQFRAKGIPSEVLLVLSKSMVLQAQLKKECAGTILAAVPNEALKRILIPILPGKIQQKIVALVQQSHEAKRKCTELLEGAKRKVELEIDKK